MSRSSATTHVERLGALVEACGDADTPEAVGNCAVDAALDLFDADAVVVAQLEDGEFVPLSAHTERIYAGAYRSRESGVAGRTLDAGEPIVVDDARHDERATPTSDALRSVLSVPLGDGVLQVFDESPGAFSGRETAEATALSAVVEQALDRVASERESDRERRRLVALFDNLADPAVRCTHEGDVLRVAEVNSAFVDRFGYDASDVVGESLVDALVPDDESAPVERRPLSGPPDEYTESEVRRVTADGTSPFLMRRVPVTQRDDQVYFIYTDIEPLKRRERELQRQNERLDRFAGVVSHDLRNPLNVAQGRIEFVEETDENAEDLDAIGRSLDRMAAIIEDTRTMAQQGERVEAADPVSVRSVAERAWDAVVTGDATLEVSDDVTLPADSSRLAQLFENLFRNSVEHGGESVTVVVSELGDGRGFAVGDDGPGIPPEERSDVLEAGYSSPGRTESDGSQTTGLGLSIVSEIARAHDWHVRVTESDAGGARFEFRTAGADLDPIGSEEERP